MSVIEHPALASPQVLASELPQVDPHGDLDAVLELARVLKPGGELSMMFPFGVVDELILGGVARNYTSKSTQRLNLALDPGNRPAFLNALDLFTGLQLLDELIQAYRGYLAEHDRDEELEEILAALEAKRGGA